MSRWAGDLDRSKAGHERGQLPVPVLEDRKTGQVVSLAVNRPWLLQETLPEGAVTSASPVLTWSAAARHG